MNRTARKYNTKIHQMKCYVTAPDHKKQTKFRPKYRIGSVHSVHTCDYTESSECEARLLAVALRRVGAVAPVGDGDGPGGGEEEGRDDAEQAVLRGEAE